MWPCGRPPLCLCADATCCLSALCESPCWSHHLQMALCQEHLHTCLGAHVASGKLGQPDEHRGTWLRDAPGPSVCISCVQAAIAAPWVVFLLLADPVGLDDMDGPGMDAPMDEAIAHEEVEQNAGGERCLTHHLSTTSCLCSPLVLAHFLGMPIGKRGSAAAYAGPCAARQAAWKFSETQARGDCCQLNSVGHSLLKRLLSLCAILPDADTR